MPTNFSSVVTGQTRSFHEAKNDSVSRRKGSSIMSMIRCIFLAAVGVSLVMFCLHPGVLQTNQVMEERMQQELLAPKIDTEISVLESMARNVSQPLPLSTIPAVLRNDTVMATRRGPIVIAQYKLIFFATPKVGSTAWKRLFQRIRGHNYWNHRTSYAHVPDKNGLVKLLHYTTEQAQQMLASPEWTKAIWVRDPKERFLSAYLDKAFYDDGSHLQRCCQKQINQTSCFEEGRSSLKGFLHVIATVCPDNPHWIPQHQKIDQKYWPILTHPQNTLFVGHLESGQTDAKALLSRLYETNDALGTEPGFRPTDKQINKMITDSFIPSPTNQSLWDRYCTSGWDKDDGHPTSPVGFLETTGTVQHITKADTKLAQYYDENTERAVEEYYAGDYELRVLNLKRKSVVYPAS